MDYPPLSAYGVVGNDNRAALVSRHGSVDWCCFPHLESPSVFAGILDADGGGRFRVSPRRSYTAEQEYVDRTNVLQTIFRTAGGQAVLTDCMPSVDDDAVEWALPEAYQQSIYRKLRCESGEMTFDLSFAPRFDYARTEPELVLEEASVRARADGEELVLHGDVDFAVDRSDATATVTLAAGEECRLGLQYGHDRRLSPGEIDDLIEETVAYWRDWLSDCETAGSGVFEGRWGAAVTRSTLVLELLIHRDTGAIPAAVTTSIPEEIGGDRNWDYRYNWIRDAKFTVQALFNVGQRARGHEYFEWFMDVVHDDPEDIQPLYGLHGEREIGEVELEHLSGYRNSWPVRVGNAAADQPQHDVYGTIVQGIHETLRHDGALSEERWREVREIVSYVCEIWDDPDAGIWEFRDDRRHYVHSKLLCWVALDRGIALAEEFDFDGPLDRWVSHRDAIHAEVLERGYSESLGSFTQYYDTDEAVDATALLIPINGFLPPDDPRVQSTVETVQEKLTTGDGLVVRFVDSEVREDETDPFLWCSFWLVDALVLSGRIDEAEDLYTTVLEYLTPLALLSEKVDGESGRHLGNFPQAFSHIGLLNSALYLQRARNATAEDGLDPTAIRTGGIEPTLTLGERE